MFSPSSREKISLAPAKMWRKDGFSRARDRYNRSGLGLLAALGAAEVVVYRRPRIAILSTGMNCWRFRNHCCREKSAIAIVMFFKATCKAVELSR